MNEKREQGIVVRLEHVPSGLDHVKMIETMGELNRLSSGPKLDDCKDELKVLGISLSILYQVATCHRKCFGGPHVLESLTARTYNLACSAYTLIGRGLYDEALNLIRSMGEIANLIGLLFNDLEERELWLHSDKSTRFRRFTPAKVRESLKELKGGMFLYADKEWYSRFCEDYTHVHPGTKPNVHNEQAQGHTGGAVQEEGLRVSIVELTNVCTFIALFVSQYGGLDDLFKELREALDAIGEN